jgi:hypothetical protein
VLIRFGSSNVFVLNYRGKGACAKKTLWKMLRKWLNKEKEAEIESKYKGRKYNFKPGNTSVYSAFSMTPSKA